jgi:hypothetical protein
LETVYPYILEGSSDFLWLLSRTVLRRPFLIPRSDRRPDGFSQLKAESRKIPSKFHNNDNCHMERMYFCSELQGKPNGEENPA